MITRTVNGVEFDVDITKGNEIYFDTDFYDECNSTGINDILFAIYDRKKEYTPESLFLELTGKCNFNCPFCYIHTCDNAKKQNNIRFCEMKEDLDWLIENGLICCTISGGECLMHPDFEELYTYLKSRGILVTVLSNLSLLTEQTIELFRKLPPYKLDVTIYAMEPDAMSKVTGQRKVGSQQVLDHIITLKDMGIHVTCKTPYNKLTERQIPMIEEWCKQHDIPYFFSMEIFENYEGKDMQSYGMDDEAVFNDRVSAKLGKLGDSRSDEIKQKRNFDCKGGQYGLFISYDYKLRPCMPFYGVPEANFDIKPEGLKVAVEKMKAFINQYNKTNLKYCSGCKNSDVCDLCIIAQLSQDKEQILKRCQSFRCIEG